MAFGGRCERVESETVAAERAQVEMSERSASREQRDVSCVRETPESVG